MFGAAVSPAKPASRYFPNSAAVKAAIVDVIFLLQAFGAASWADTALMQPIAVSIQAVFNVLFINFYIEAGG